MIHKISGNSFLPFGSFYDEPISREAHHLVCRQQMTHRTCIDELYCFPCEVHIEPIRGIVSILIGTSSAREDLTLFPVHHYLKLKPNTYFNFITLSDEAIFDMISLGLQPTVTALSLPYRYHTPSTPFSVLDIFDCYLSEVSQYHFRCTAHDYYVLLYVTQGTLTLTLNGAQRILNEHDLILCGPNQPYPRQIYANQPCTYLTVVFDMGTSGKSQLLDHIFHCPSTVRNILGKLMEQSISTSCYTYTLMLCYLQEIVTHLMQLSDTFILDHPANIQQDFHNDLLDQILAYMNRKVTEPITIEEICHKFFMSRSSLQALFKAHLHTSPKNYLINIKLQKSKELIRAEQHTISEIAYLLGFSSIHYFSRLFKKYYNLSPSEYAKKATELENEDMVCTHPSTS